MNDFGFLNCNKPPGMTSRDVVNVVQRRIRPAKVGHAGTLDPLAEGVLVVGVGPAVRLIPYVQQQPKHYLGSFRLAASSESGDLEGEVLQHPELPIPTRAQLDLAVEQLTGEIDQVPPAHSAIWVDGQRAYKRVRAGEKVDMPSRTVMIHSLEIVQYDFPELKVDIVCGSGTYIRTLGKDLAQLAGSTAVMTHLRRLGIGEFRFNDSVSIQQLREEPIDSLLVPPTLGVTHLPRLEIDHQQSVRLGHGLCIDGVASSALLRGGCAGESASECAEDCSEAVAIRSDGCLRSIVRRKRGMWCPYRVFPVGDPVADGGVSPTETDDGQGDDGV